MACETFIIYALELIIEVALGTTSLVEYIDDIAKLIVLYKLIWELLLYCHRLAVFHSILML